MIVAIGPRNAEASAAAAVSPCVVTCSSMGEVLTHGVIRSPGNCRAVAGRRQKSHNVVLVRDVEAVAGLNHRDLTELEALKRWHSVTPSLVRLLRRSL